jgi:prevent-host-death family protein
MVGMKTVGMFEAKNRLSELVTDFVEKGEPVLLTRNGRPVAQIVPVKDRTDAQEAMDWILSQHWRLNGLSIREMIDEGKRL